MRTSLILVVAVTTLLAIGSCTSDLQLTPPTVGTDQRFLRSTKAAETEENGAGDEERGIKITDPAILENLAKFDDWVGQGKTAEKIYQELGLKFSWKIAYQTSR
ncbi:hypothetical protein PF005_g11807 [Phytophthora fragariae]|uniref:RxLR effector protein n=1 Tax=Phytophthora fragariae TaxID=53985 RepID=A0A6A3UAB6_9STRA|nr:hypothetical protein PF003_g22538 [Phytophthora fragariae]KAE8943627.1 hypothetical protein PF009_g6662 [Phytophthora fragariae]KAE9001525.1 hypothetical protein PF011_g13706 [Phytophthora fragariae]KAE9101476.1 hypothetical protein PF010_g14436 [Phytophthora fragariae]KAE9103940.1 hypothetical protein PF007_g14219 [Phytophthora fragariae]